MRYEPDDVANWLLEVLHQAGSINRAFHVPQAASWFGRECSVRGADGFPTFSPAVLAPLTGSPPAARFGIRSCSRGAGDEPTRSPRARRYPSTPLSRGTIPHGRRSWSAAPITSRCGVGNSNAALARTGARTHPARPAVRTSAIVGARYGKCHGLTASPAPIGPRATHTGGGLGEAFCYRVALRRAGAFRGVATMKLIIVLLPTASVASVQAAPRFLWKNNGFSHIFYAFPCPGARSDAAVARLAGTRKARRGRSSSTTVAINA
jgi:hypothetical protein